MPEFIDEETEYTRPGGRSAVRLPVPEGEPVFAATVGHWLITYPPAHPLWSQYYLSGIRLMPLDGFGPAKLQFPGATHEIMLVVLHPDYGPYTVESMAKYSTPGSPEFQRLPLLTPINIAWQFAGTDEECRKLMQAAAWGVVANILWPETADAPEYVRSGWDYSLTETLKHFRGQPHDAGGGSECQH